MTEFKAALLQTNVSNEMAENVAFGLRRHLSLTEGEIEARVQECLTLVGMRGTDKLKPAELSGGMKRRVGFARAIALKPDLLLLDEPMAGMNLEEKEDMARYIIDLNEEWDMTIVMIEHDMDVALDLADFVTVLHQGRAIVEGRPEEVKRHPDVMKIYLGAE